MISLAKLKPEAQRAMAITVPVLVLVFAGFLIVPKAAGICSISRSAAIQQREAEAASREIATQASRAQQQRMAAWPESRDEQLVFLKELNRLVAGSGVRLISYRPPTLGAAPTSQPASGALLVKPIATEVTVAGSYRDLVTLFRSLAHAGR